MGLKGFKNRIKVLLSVFLFSLILISLPAIGQYQENSSEQNVKRVICLVFDDSGSMLNDGQSYDYASYALQNVIGLMNDQDELAVAKLSDAGKIIEYRNRDYNERIENILEVKNYNSVAESTDFMVVDAAANYLKDKKNQYGNSDDYKYYFVVLTDGKFDNYPRRLPEYLENLKSYFVNSYFKGIFIGIGSDLQETMESDVLSNDNYYYLKAQGREDIVNATFKAHDIIYNRNVISESDLSLRNNGELLSFYAENDVNRLLIFEQDQDAGVTSISSKDVYMDKKQTFTTSKSRQPALVSQITYSGKENGSLPSGNVVIEFNKSITKSSDKLRVMVEYTDSEGKDELIIETKGPTARDDDITEGTTNLVDQTSTIEPIEPTDTTDTIELTDPTRSTDPTDSTEETASDPNTPHPIPTNNHFCICPILRVLLFLFLIGLIKTILDRNRNRKNYENSRLSNDANLENYRYREEYYRKRNRRYLILILIVLLLFILCHLFWCRLPFYICLRNCCLLPTRCRLTPVTLGPSSPMAPITPGPSSPVTPITPRPSTPPIPMSPVPMPVTYKLLIAPFIGLALLLGYIFKNRFDTKYHAFEKSVGNKLEKSAAIKVNRWTKFVPYIPETGYGNDIFLKASKKNDRVIIPKEYLTEDMLRDGQEISQKSDFTLFEDIPFTREINGVKYTYIYKSYKKFEKNT